MVLLLGSLIFLIIISYDLVVAAPIKGTEPRYATPQPATKLV